MTERTTEQNIIVFLFGYWPAGGRDRTNQLISSAGMYGDLTDRSVLDDASYPR